MSDAHQFEALVLPHLDAGYNLARWLLRDDAEAEDVAQEAAIRALRYIASLKDAPARPWFLAIVRNACFTHLKQRRGVLEVVGFDDESLEALQLESGSTHADPSQLLAQRRDKEAIDSAIRSLPPALREAIVLREIEGLEYAEIAHVAQIPVGTVMSRLSRARARLKDNLVQAGMKG